MSDKNRTAEDNLYEKAMKFYEASQDKDPDNDTSEEFFQRLRKIIYYAMLYRTPEELVHERVDADLPNLGMLNSAISEPKLEDLENPRNYLKDDEMEKLDNTIEFYIEMAKPQLTSGKPMNKEDWFSRLNGFLQMNGYSVLLTRSNVSKEEMKQKVKEQYEKFLQS